MQKPQPAVYIIGNKVSLVAITGFSGLIAYQWWVVPGVTAWAPVVAFVGTSMAFSAHGKISAYSEWREAWDGMDDNPAPGRLRSARRRVFVVCAWLAVAFVLACLDRHQPINLLAIGGFVLATLVMLRRYLRAGKPAAPAKARPIVMVSAVLPVPRSSPSVQQTLQVLPAYCIGLNA